MLFITLAKLRGFCISLSGPSFPIVYCRFGLSIQSAETQCERGWAGDELALGLLQKVSKTIFQKRFRSTVGVLRYMVYNLSMRDRKVVFTY